MIIQTIVANILAVITSIKQFYVTVALKKITPMISAYNLTYIMFSLIKNRSIQIVIILFLYVMLADILSTPIHQLFYTISLLIKELLIWLMPLTIGVFIANSISSFKQKVINFILLLFIFETISNFSCVWYSFFTANLIADIVPPLQSLTLQTEFNPLWHFPLIRPEWWSSDKGVLFGLIIGCTISFQPESSLHFIIKKLYKIIEFILTRIFARFIPIFILGFAAHMYQLKILGHIIENYIFLLSWILFSLTFYTYFLFFLGSSWSFSRTLHDIHNLLPAGLIALTSGCSLSTIPWTISGTSKNLQDKSLAEIIIPATTNTQQIGDCIINAFLCFVIYKNFNGQNPDLLLWLNFSIIFTLARFITAAVLGGAIFIMIPIYENYLYFNAEMTAIILALNVILNPIVTSFNVIANGALCKLYEIVWSKYNLVLIKKDR